MARQDELVRRVDAAWLKEDGPSGDVILSSRIRLARNLAGYPFPHRLSAGRASDLVRDVRAATARLEALGRFDVVDMADLSDLERQVLVEKHVISPQMALGGSTLVLSADDMVSVMVNEEDHLRIQCLLPGLSAGHAWERASAVDDALEGELDYAFTAEKGFLTSCPTNTGTGLRVSVMIHVPGLAMVGGVGQLFSALGKVGAAVRGLFGEGTQTAGNIYQVSNQVSLGRSEEDIIAGLENLARQITDQERSAREAMMNRDRTQVEDRVYRAYGILMGARVMSSDEMMKLISDLKLGMDLNLVPQIEPEAFKTLLVMARPGYLQLLAGEELGPRDRDVRRASLVRRHLAGTKPKGG